MRTSTKMRKFIVNISKPEFKMHNLDFNVGTQGTYSKECLNKVTLEVTQWVCIHVVKASGHIGNTLSISTYIGI